MKSSRSKAKPKKISITLPAWEGEMLKSYAKRHQTTCPAAAHKMIRQALRQFKSEMKDMAKAEPENQLNIFDSIQVDIFNNTAKVECNDGSLSQPKRAVARRNTTKTIE